MSSKDDHTLHSRYKVELLEGLRTTLSVVKDAAGNVGVPGLQAGIGGLGVIIDAGLTLLDNSESTERLLQRISELDAVIQNVKETTEERIPQAVFARLNRLSQQWQIKGEEIQALQSRSIARRFFGSKKDADAIQACMNSISESIHAFNLEGTLRIEIGIDAMRADIRKINAKLEYVPHGDMSRVKNPQNLELTSSYLSRIDASNPLYIEARSMFKYRWLNPERQYSSIQAIYEVVYRGKSAMRHLQRYDDYRSKLRSEQPRNRLVEEILFHCWTRRACNIADDGSASAIPCSLKGCNLCHVLQCDFSGDNARRGGNWGTGIYLTTSSEKADAYARNLNDRSGKRHLVLLSKVLVGTPKRVYVKNKSLTQPPSGTDSIKAMTKDIGGVVKYSERVVYRDDAVLPWLVIIYDR